MDEDDDDSSNSSSLCDLTFELQPSPEQELTDFRSKWQLELQQTDKSSDKSHTDKKDDDTVQAREQQVIYGLVVIMV